ncbi:MAG: glycoside hydrolase family 97 N-terminal domain-containing protein [Phycisphaerales bacterium JB038]
MRLRYCISLVIGAVVAWGASSVAAAPSDRLTLTSPDARLTVTLEVLDPAGSSASPVYRLARDGKPVVLPSRLGLVTETAPLFRGLHIASTERRSVDETWRPVYGERSTIRDHHNSLTVNLRGEHDSKITAMIELRAYNEGVAFCYRLPEREGCDQVQVVREATEFRLAGEHRAWPVYSAQGVYSETSLAELKSGCERPLVLRNGAGAYIAIGEARLVDFARMKLGPLEAVDNALQAELAGEVLCPLPFRSPWRVIMVADSPGELLENNDLFLNLNDPCEIDDVSWIVPGKVIREVTLTTEGGIACVDFASARGLQYVEFDAGWYGHEYDDDSDATTVTVDPRRSPGPLDLPKIIRYAEDRGIGVLLYVNRRALEKQLDDVLPLFHRWGVKGVKYGFVNVGSQQWTEWLHSAVRKAAEHRLMVDVHDEYRPTGYSRTYPNLMTQEGIAGDETSPTNEQTLTILFTRMLCGPGDNTICYYDSRVAENASHAYQLAKAVCIYSPWQFLYWYDRPANSPSAKGGAGGEENVIGDEPELEFFAHLPTTWDDTRVIHGAISEYAVIARRKGAEWFVGCMNGSSPRRLELPLSFLDAGVMYTAHVYSDDPTVQTRTQVRIERAKVDSKAVLQIDLPPRGGEAMRIVPE